MNILLQIAAHAAISGAEAAALALFCGRLLGKRHARRALYALAYAALWAANLCASARLPGLSVPPYLAAAGVLLIALLLYSGTVFQRVFAALAFFAYAATTEVLSVVSLSWLTGYVFAEVPEQTLLYFIGAFAAKALLLAAVLIAAGRKRERFLPMPASHQAVLLLTAGICVFLAYADMFAVTQSGARTTFLHVLSEAGITALSVAAFYVYGAFQRHMHRELNSAVLARQTAQSERYYRRMDEVHREMRAIKHDFTNHLMSLDQFLQAGEYEELGLYLRKYIGEASRAVSETITGTVSIDGLISVKKQAASDRGIRFEARAGGITKIRVNPMHLSIVLGNVLDNAIEACAKLPPEAERYIELGMKTDGDDLCIVVKNPSPPVAMGEDGLPRTSKGGEHGVGLVSVKSAVEKHGGRMRVESRGGEFIFSAYMENNEDS
jgi:signal transduction histidine kinase